MNPEDDYPNIPRSPDPIEDAYLHRDVHPDDQGGGHAARPSSSSLLFPKAQSANNSPDDVSMFI